MLTNPHCQNDFNLFVQNLGGIQIFIIIILATVFGIFAVIFFLQFNSSSILKDDSSSFKMKKAFEELDFVDRDMH